MNEKNFPFFKGKKFLLTVEIIWKYYYKVKYAFWFNWKKNYSQVFLNYGLGGKRGGQI